MDPHSSVPKAVSLRHQATWIYLGSGQRSCQTSRLPGHRSHHQDALQSDCSRSISADLIIDLGLANHQSPMNRHV